MSRKLTVEELEQRIAPTVLFGWFSDSGADRDADGGLLAARGLLPRGLIPPTVDALTPAPGSILSTSPSTIVATFSEDLDFTTVTNPSNFTLEASGGDGTFGDGNEIPIAATFITYSPTTYAATFYIDTAALTFGLLSDDLYQVTITDSVTDLAGNPLDGEFTGVFPSGDTVAGGDFIATFTVDLPPMVTDVTPAPGATVGSPATIVITLSEDVNPATINPTTLLLEASGGDGTFGDGNEISVLPSSVTYDSVTDTATFTVAGALAAETYQVTLTDTAMDLTGNALDGEFQVANFPPSGNGVAGGDFQCTFIVSAAPVVTSIIPAPGAQTGSPITIVATFNIALDQFTVNSSTFLLEGSGGDGTFGDGNEVVYAPAFVTYQPPIPGADPPVPAGATFWVVGTLPEDVYQVTLTDSITNQLGIPLDGDFTGTFPSGDGTAGGDFLCTFIVLVPPNVISVTPVPGSLLTDSPPSIVVEFNEELISSTINPTTFLLIESGEEVEDDPTWDEGNEVTIPYAYIQYSYNPLTSESVAVFVPAIPLDDGHYQIVVTDGVLDTDGAALDGEFTGAAFPPSGNGQPGGDFMCTFTITTEAVGTIVPANTLFTWTDSNGDLCSLYYWHPGPYSPDNPPYVELWSPDPFGPPAPHAVGDGDDLGYVYVFASNALAELEIQVISPGANDIPVGSIVTYDGEARQDEIENGDPPAFGSEIEDGKIAEASMFSINIGVGYGPTPLSYGTVETVLIGGQLREILLGGDFGGTDLIQTGAIEVEADEGDGEDGEEPVVADSGDYMAFAYIGGDLGWNAAEVCGIAVGPGGSGNLDFLFVEGDAYWEHVYLYDQGTWVDDGGGILDIRVGDRESYIQAIPMIGGGVVIQEIYIASPNTGLFITSTGAGGDIGLIGGYGNMSIVISGVVPLEPGDGVNGENGEGENGEGENGEGENGEEPEPGSLIVGGNVDVAYIWSDRGINVIYNNTQGGDIYDIVAEGPINTIHVTNSGAIGWLFTGARPPGGSAWSVGSQVLDYLYFPMGNLIADGNINYIATGLLTSDTVYTPGRLNYLTSTYGEPTEGYFILGSHNWDGFTDIIAEGGIGVIASPQTIAGAWITTLSFDPLNGLSQEPIAMIRAGNISGSMVQASRITTLYAFTGLFGTSISTYHWDPVLDEYIGGGIGVLNVGGMSYSTIESLDRVGYINVGTEGLDASFPGLPRLSPSSIVLHDGAGLVRVQGAVTEGSSIIVDGYVGAISISTHVSDDASIVVNGYVGNLSIYKSITDNSEVIINGGAGVIRVGGSATGYSEGVTWGSLLEVNGPVSSVTIRGELLYSDLYFSENVGVLYIMGASKGTAHEGGTVQVDGNLGLLRTSGEFRDTLFSVDGNLGVAYMQGELTEASSIEVDGNVNALVARDNVEDADIVVGGNLGVVWVVGNFTGSLLEVGGNLNAFVSTGNVNELSGIYVDGQINCILVLGSLVESDVWSGYGMNSIRVVGSIDDSYIDTSVYNGSGDPVGGGIRTIYAGRIVSSDILSQAGFGTILVTGDITDSYVSATAYDNYGGGSLVGGGGINYLRAGELVDSTVESYGNMRFVSLGLGGMDASSWLGTLHSSGNLLFMNTPGLIFGEINVAGNVGSILTAGKNAIAGMSPIDFQFLDQTGTPTGGTLEVAGSITGLIS